MKKVCCIAAMDEARLIGANNALPWHIPADMQRFKRLTMGSNLLMGRSTYESIPARFRPLPGRHTTVVSRTPATLDLPTGVDRTADPLRFIEEFRAGQRKLPGGEVLWIIGGGQIYSLCLQACDELHLTRVSGTYAGDAFFPEFEPFFRLLEQESHSGYSFERWVRIDQ